MRLKGSAFSTGRPLVGIPGQIGKQVAFYAGGGLLYDRQTRTRHAHRDFPFQQTIKSQTLKEII